MATALVGCGGPDTEAPIGLDWNNGEVFHVGAFYMSPNVMHEENPVDLEAEESPTFGANWSDEIIWTYQVIEAGFVPESHDELFSYAVTAGGEIASLTVIKAYIDISLNDDPDMLETDPVIYLVFREDRDRLAAIVSFTNDADGYRVERAWSSHELGRSYSHLSQSQLTAAPALLAPFGARWGTGDTMLENGSYVSTIEVDDGVTDAVYEDELGGGMIASRYEYGEPWPTWTVADNMETRLMDPHEVESKRADMRFFMPQPAEDFDYRAALSSSLDLDAILTLDEETMGGGFEASVRDGYEPWAGNWWPLTKGNLVFGSYGGDPENHGTISSEIRTEVDEHKVKMDELSAEIRDMEDGEEKTAKVEEYRAEQKALVEILVDFYRGILADLDGGLITVANGKVTHTEDGWEYTLDALSPMDKLALDIYYRDEVSHNPFFLSAWEILNSYNPAGENWWGHCNGWAAAAILTNEPREEVYSEINGERVVYTTADIKGLFSEAHYSTRSRFYGARYNGEEDDVTDLSPKAFHQLVTYYIREMGVPMVFDTTATEQVWNFPIWSADLSVEETTPEGLASAININTAGVEELSTLPGIAEVKSLAIIDYREANGPFQNVADIEEVSGIGPVTFADLDGLITVNPFQRTFSVDASVTLTTDGVSEDHVDSGDPESFVEVYSYTLETDADGVVVGGEWEDNEKHPDFAWIPYFNPRTASKGSSENPYLDWGDLLNIVGSEFERE